MDSKDIVETSTAEAKPNVFQFDLGRYDVLEKSNEGVEVELIMPGDVKTNIWLRVLGADADSVMEAMFAAQSRRFNEARDSGNKTVPLDAKLMHEENTEQLAAAVVSWSIGRDPWTHNIPYKGELLQCNRQNVLKMFKSIPDMRALVDKTMAKRELFYKG
jgi:hypothetical protein